MDVTKRILRGIFTCLFALALLSGNAKALDWMGYFNMEHKNPDYANKQGFFDLHDVSMILQHEIGMFKFYNELEFEHASEGPLSDTGSLQDGNNKVKVGFGEIMIERSWVQANFHRMFNVKAGVELTPTLWWLNHYPNLSIQFSRPQMMKNIFKFGYAGFEFNGKMPYGFGYYTWVSNGALTTNHSNKENRMLSFGGKLSWDGQIPGGYVSVGALGAKYNDEGSTTSATGNSSSPWGLEANISWADFLLWSEYHKSSKRKGYYSVLSYAIPIGEEATLSPFVFFDKYNEDTTKGAANEDSNRWAVGLNFKPITTVAIKAEFNRTFSRIKSSTTVPHTTGLNFGFIYFFN